MIDYLMCMKCVMNSSKCHRSKRFKMTQKLTSVIIYRANQNHLACHIEIAITKLPSQIQLLHRSNGTNVKIVRIELGECFVVCWLVRLLLFAIQRALCSIMVIAYCTGTHCVCSNKRPDQTITISVWINR